MEYSQFLELLVWAACIAVGVLIWASLAVCARLRGIHHSVRNIEHYAKSLHRSKHEPWKGEDDEPPFKDTGE